MTRFLPRLRLFVVAAILVAATFGNVFSQTPTAPEPSELDPVIKLVREKKSKEALDALKQKVKENKNNAEAWYYLGVVYLQIADFKKAADAFRDAIKLKPTPDARAHSGYAYALLRRGKLDDALQEARKSISIDPKNIDALYTLGVINLRSGNKEEALKNADALIALEPGLAEAYLIKSQAFVSINGDAIMRPAAEPKGERISRYRSAAEAIEQYLKLSKAPAEAQLWKDQLESLKFYVADKSGTPEQVFIGRDVTTKARLISKPEPVYPRTARNEMVTGTVVLRCVFAADGTVKHVLVLQSLPYGLTDVSVAAAKKIKFVPATIDGKPVSMFMQLEYNFNLY
ncbi:MAG TPA: TonB family protein [Pyrinomonadaceae bacterium]|nr:TonB family protein [Pyrinomonadaceae bacterium]